MAGQIIKLIEAIVEKSSGGNPVVASSTRIKIIMRGVIPKKYNEHSPDDPEVIAKLLEIAKELQLNMEE